MTLLIVGFSVLTITIGVLPTLAIGNESGGAASCDASCDSYEDCDGSNEGCEERSCEACECESYNPRDSSNNCCNDACDDARKTCEDAYKACDMCSYDECDGCEDESKEDGKDECADESQDECKDGDHEPSQTDEYIVNIDPDNFVEVVDNPYFPLTPGMTFIYEGETEDGTVRVEDYITRETKQVMGVICVVVRNREWEDGDLVEETFDWYAQDAEGNVWYFGEDSKEYDDGDVSTTGSWEAGVDGALPGIIMKAKPQVGDSYRQEYYAGEAEDMGEVLSLAESASVIAGDFDDCLLTKDWTPLEPGVSEHKYYAPGVGLVLEVMVEGGSERVELVEITTE
jgi:hypothetical protein